MRYLNGRLEAERAHSPRESNETEEQEFNYESFSGSYSTKRFPAKQAGSRSVVIRPATKRMKAMRRLTSDHGTLDRLFNGIGLDAA